MPSIERSIFIPVDLKTVYELAKDLPAFVDYLPAVRSITVVERGNNYLVTDWDLDVAGRSYRWRERDEFHDYARAIRYRLVVGDLSRYEGEWRFDQAGDGVQVRLFVDFEVGVPMLGALLDPMFARGVEENKEQLLRALRERAERRKGEDQQGKQ